MIGYSVRYEEVDNYFRDSAETSPWYWLEVHKANTLCFMLL